MGSNKLRFAHLLEENYDELVTTISSKISLTVNTVRVVMVMNVDLVMHWHTYRWYIFEVAYDCLWL